MLRVVYLTVFYIFISCSSALATGEDTLVSLAQHYSNSGRHYDSYQTYWQAFMEVPENVDVNYNLGLAAVKISDYESAVMAFERVLLLDPDATQAKIEMAKAFYKLGAKSSARHYFAQALAANDLPDLTKKNIELFLKNTLGTD